MLENVTKSVLYGLFLRTPEGIVYLFIIYHYYDKFIYFLFQEIPTRKGNMANQQISNKQVRNELKTHNKGKFKICISVLPKDLPTFGY